MKGASSFVRSHTVRHVKRQREHIKTLESPTRSFTAQEEFRRIYPRINGSFRIEYECFTSVFNGATGRKD